MESLESNTEIEGFTLPKESPSVEGEVKEDEVILTDEERTNFRSLLTLGDLTKEFEVLGHKVRLRTLSVADELRVGIASKEYRDSEAFARAYQSAVIAASIVESDGEQWYIPFSSDESDSYVFSKKLEKVHSLYPLVVSEIYKNYLEVEREFASLAKKLGKLGKDNG